MPKQYVSIVYTYMFNITYIIYYVNMKLEMCFIPPKEIIVHSRIISISDWPIPLASNWQTSATCESESGGIEASGEPYVLMKTGLRLSP